MSAGADPALVQDALFDAEEHLQAEMAVGGPAGAGGEDGALSEAERAARFAAMVEGTGSPEEVAAAYVGASPSGHVSFGGSRWLGRASDAFATYSSRTSDSSPAFLPVRVLRTGRRRRAARRPCAYRRSVRDAGGGRRGCSEEQRVGADLRTVRRQSGMDLAHLHAYLTRHWHRVLHHRRHRTLHGRRHAGGDHRHTPLHGGTRDRARAGVVRRTPRGNASRRADAAQTAGHASKYEVPGAHGVLAERRTHPGPRWCTCCSCCRLASYTSPSR